MQELDKELLEQLSQLKAPGCPPIGTLGEFLDEKVDAEEKQSLEAHLQACPSCINRLIDLRELAHLEKAGEEPPRALVRELKDLVPSQGTLKDRLLSALGRVAETFSDTWASMRQWATPRFIGETAAVSAVAVLVLFIGINYLRRPPGTQSGGEVVKALTELTVSEQVVLHSLSLISAGLEPLQKQLISALEQLPKTLLQEQTRGATNVEVYRKAAPATVLVVTDKSLGSGAVISSQGEVLTNWHVIRGASQIAVVFKPRSGVEIKKELAFAAILIKVDQVADLALLKIQAPPEDLSYLPLGSVIGIEAGQDVHAIGHPSGEVWTYTTGTISQVRPSYQWTGLDGLLHQSKVIQIQTALNPGSSGGPLLNGRAEIIGINSFRREGEGLNYAVAVDAIEEFLKRVESRVAAPAPSPRYSSYRMEPYGPDIVGVYIDARVPPPDVWLVYRDSRGNPSYAARGAIIPTKIDTIMVGGDPQWESLAYYFDGNCDGVIDLIGYGSKQGEINRYRLPEGPLQVASLAKELAQALQKGIIPYPELGICR